MTKPLKDRFILLKQYFRQEEVRSLFIVLTSVFVSALGSTIIITGVWPYLEVVRSDNSNLLTICIHLLIIIEDYYSLISDCCIQIFIQLDDSVQLDEYGYVVAADALAQMIFSPIFGYICDRMGSIRLVSLTCSLIFTLGHLFYSSIALVPKTIGFLVQARLYAIFIARFLVGIGTGNQYFFEIARFWVNQSDVF